LPEEEGPLLLVGGAEWQEGCDFDAQAVEAAGRPEVLILPTAAAYEHPERAVETAAAWFRSLGASARGLEVLRRPDAEDLDKAAIVRQARFIYLGGGSPLHLRSVLKDSAVWNAIVEAWHDGATVAGSSAGAMVLTDPMVDPRGGAFTLGLGLCEQIAVVPHFDQWSHDKTRRTLALAPKGVPLVGIDERTAVIRDPSGTWTASGAGKVSVFVDGNPAGLDTLP
jgi:cyanophycinase